MADAVCPRCGHINKFRQGRLPDTCVCMVCESQLDWRNIPGAGPDCRPLSPDDEPATQPGAAAEASKPADLATTDPREGEAG